MYKYVFLLSLCVALLFCFSGCEKNHTTKYVAILPTETPVSDTTSFVETSSPRKSVSFNLTLEEMSLILEPSNVFENFVTYETPEYTVHRTGYGTNGALLFSTPESDKIEAAFFLAYSRASRGSNATESAIYAQELLCEYCDNSGIEYYAEEVEQEPYLVFAVYALDSTLENLPLSIREFRGENEFFASEERTNMFCNLMSSCKYQELRDYIGEFIAEGKCPDNDVTYSLVDMLDQIIPLMETCYVEVDKVEKNAKIYYKNVAEITRKINVVPVIETDKDYGAFLKVTIGFKRSDWLFFDTVYFASAATETEKYLFSNTNTDVLNGGNIFEWDSLGTSAHNALMTICNSDDAIIRFENSDTEEHIDHELTEGEIQALVQLNHIRDLHDEIWDSLKEWEQA